MDKPFYFSGIWFGTNWFEREIQRAILQIRINGLGIENEQLFSQKLIFTIKRASMRNLLIQTTILNNWHLNAQRNACILMF